MAAPKVKKQRVVPYTTENLSAFKRAGIAAGREYERYLITGDESRYKRFTRLWARHWENTKAHRDLRRAFGDNFLKVAGDVTKRRSLIRELFVAFKKDLRMPGAARLTPAHYEDLINDVHKVRKGLRSILGLPVFKGISARRIDKAHHAILKYVLLDAKYKKTLVQAVETNFSLLKTKAKRAAFARKNKAKPNDVEKIHSVLKELRTSTRGIPGKAVLMLRKPAFKAKFKHAAEVLERIKSKYGVKLTALVAKRLPRENARQAAKYLQQFAYGDFSAASSFKALYKTNKGNVTFIKELNEAVKRRAALRPLIAAYLKNNKAFIAYLKKEKSMEFIKSKLAKRHHAALDAASKKKAPEFIGFLDKKLKRKDFRALMGTYITVEVKEPLAFFALLGRVSKNISKPKGELEKKYGENFIQVYSEILLSSLGKRAAILLYKDLRGDVAAGKKHDTIINSVVFGERMDSHDTFVNEYKRQWNKYNIRELTETYRKHAFSIAAREVFLAAVSGALAPGKMISLSDVRLVYPRWLSKHIVKNMEKLLLQIIRPNDEIAAELEARKGYKHLEPLVKLKLSGAKIAALYKVLVRRAYIEIAAPKGLIADIEKNFKKLNTAAKRSAYAKKLPLKIKEAEKVALVEKLYAEINAFRTKTKGVPAKALEALRKASFVLKPLDELYRKTPPLLAEQKKKYKPVYVPAFKRAFGFSFALMKTGREREAEERLGTEFNKARAALFAFKKPVDKMETRERYRTMRFHAISIIARLNGIKKVVHRYKIFKPVLKDINNYIRKYKLLVNKAKELYSTNQKESIKKLQSLAKEVITSSELRNTVKIAASFAHLLQGGTSVSADEIRRLMGWYDEIKSETDVGEAKATLVSKVVSKLLKKIDKEAHKFVMGSDVYEISLVRTYQTYRNYKKMRKYKKLRKSLVKRYGKAFVEAVEKNFEHLRYYDSTLSYRDYSLLRCIRALARPGKVENEKKMIAVYGATVVDSIKKNLEQLKNVKSAADLKNVPAELKTNMLSLFKENEKKVTEILKKKRIKGRFMTRMREVASTMPGMTALVTSVLSLSDADVDQLQMRFELVKTNYENFFQGNYYPLKSMIDFSLLTRVANKYTGVPVKEVTLKGIGRILGHDAIKTKIRHGKEQFDDFINSYVRYRTGRQLPSDAALDDLKLKFTVLDALYLQAAVESLAATTAFGDRAKTAVIETLLEIHKRDPHLIGAFLVRVLPTFTRVCTDERTLELLLSTFKTLLGKRFAEGLNNISYTTHIRRKYFLRIFKEIEDKLVTMGKAYTHRMALDELMMSPIGGTAETYRRPPGYAFKGKPIEWLRKPPVGVPVKAVAGLTSLNIKADPTMPQFPSYLPESGVTLKGGAADIFKRMDTTLRAPSGFMPTMGVPHTIRIGALTPATILRRLTKIFGPMKAEYSDYSLAADTALAAFGGGSKKEGQEYQAGGVGVLGTWKTLTGGLQWRGVAEAEKRGEYVRRGAELELTGGAIPIGKANLDRIKAGLTYRQGETSEGVFKEGATVSKSIEGVVESYKRIAMKKGVDMFVSVSGRYLPEVAEGTGEEKRIIQDREGRLEARSYVVTKEGDVYQVAVGRDLEIDMLNYAYASADHNNVLAAIRYMGKKMFRNELPLRGFDGMAVGFTLPAHEGVTVAGAAVANVLKPFLSYSSDPAIPAVGDTRYYFESAASAAVTWARRNSKRVNIIAAFFRCTEKMKYVPARVGPVEGAKLGAERVSLNIEAMWRSLPKKEKSMLSSWEFRAVGGKPLTVGAMWKHEIPLRYKRKIGYGVIAGRTEVDLFKDFFALGADKPSISDTGYGIYKKITTNLVSVYGWEEKKARQMGWLAAVTYMHSALSDYIDQPGVAKPKKINPNYFSVLLMYWAKRHKLLVGVERLPGYINNTFDMITNAMNQIALYPETQEAILSSLATQLKDSIRKPQWNIALAWGYDGEEVGVYAMGGLHKGPITTYGNLKALVGFGRPIRWYMDILGHAYNYSPLVMSENTDENTGEFLGWNTQQVGGVTSPYVDLYGGVGAIGWPRFALRRFDIMLEISRKYDIPTVLKEGFLELLRRKPAYIKVKGVVRRPDYAMLEGAYGKDFVTAMKRHGGSLGFMLSPKEKIAKQITAMIINGNVDPKSLGMKKSPSRRDILRTAENLRKVMVALYNPAANRRFLLKNKKLVEYIVKSRPKQLEWLLKSDAEIKNAFVKKRAVDVSVAKLASVQMLPVVKGRRRLTGEELVRLINMNKAYFLASHFGVSKEYIDTERFSVHYGPSLSKRANRRKKRGTYYILVGKGTPRNVLAVGDADDLRTWTKKGWFVGREITRVDVTGKAGKYSVRFSGDRTTRVLNAWKFVGGVTLPLNRKLLRELYDETKLKNNWTVGAFLEIFRNNKEKLLAGILYGRRQFGSELWKEFTVTLSYGFTDQIKKARATSLHAYVSINWIKREVTLMTDSEAAALGVEGSELPPFQRATTAVGVEWKRLNIVAQKELSIDVFAELGAEKGKYFIPGVELVDQTARWRAVGRGGFAFKYKDLKNLKEVDIGIVGWKGGWPIVNGSITQPEMFPTYLQQMAVEGWGVMVYGKYKF